MALQLSPCQGIRIRIDSTTAFASSRLVLHHGMQCRRRSNFRQARASVSEPSMAETRASASAPILAEKIRGLNDSEIKDYKSFTPPQYTCPFPLKINPLWIKEAYMDWSLDWLRSLNCDKYLPPEVFQPIVKADLPGFSARIQSSPQDWGMKWHMKYLLWLFVFDEVLDVLDDGKDPMKVLSEVVDCNLAMLWSFPNDGRLQENAAALVKAIDNSSEFDRQMKRIEEIRAQARTQPGTAYPGQTSVQCDVYRDLWDEGIAKASPESMLRVAYATQYWLTSILDEARHRKNLTQPDSVDAYIKLRRAGSAAHGILAGTDLINGQCAPADWFNSPPMSRMLDAASDYFGWQNDLWSFKKEVLIQKDSFNIVLSISYHQNLSYQDAAEVATKMMHERSKDLDKAAAELESITPPELQELCLLYKTAARGICSGSCDWHTWSYRYRQSGHGE